MPETPAPNDSYNELLFKLAKNLYDAGVAAGGTNLIEPVRGWNDYALLKACVTNSVALI